MRWTNDYGDVPAWYWQSTAFQLPRASDDRQRRRRARAVMSMVLGLAAGM